MDDKIVFIKTAKGEAESAGQTSDLFGDAKRAFLLLDGKVSVGQLRKQAAPSLRAVLDDALQQLLSEGYIRNKDEQSAPAKPGLKMRMAAPKAGSSGGGPATEEVLDFTASSTPVRDDMAAGAVSPSVIEEMDFTSIPPTTPSAEAPAPSAPSATAPAMGEMDFSSLISSPPAPTKVAEAAPAQEAVQSSGRASLLQGVDLSSILGGGDDKKKQAEEQARAAAEAKAKAEADARMRAEAEARTKIEAEVRARAEAAAKAKAEEEARARAEAAAKAKAEAEARARIEAEVRARAEAAAKVRAEEEAKVQVEAEARAQAEARAREEMQAKIKAETEARERAEMEARIRAEAEARIAAEERIRAEAEARVRAEMEAKSRPVSGIEALKQDLAALGGNDGVLMAPLPGLGESRPQPQSRQEERQESGSGGQVSPRETAGRKQAQDGMDAILQSLDFGGMDASPAPRVDAAAPEAAQQEVVPQRTQASAVEEAKARAAAERLKAQQQADAARLKAQQEAAALRARAEQEAVKARAEEEARRLAEEQARAFAEAEERAQREAKEAAEAQARMEAQARADARNAAKDAAKKAKQDAKSAKRSAEIRRKSKENTGGIGKVIALALVLLVGTVLALPYFWPMQDYIVQAEQAFSAQLKQPVHIGGMSAATFPEPRVEVQGIEIGAGKEILVKQATLQIDFMPSLSRGKLVGKLVMDGVTVGAATFERSLPWIKGIGGGEFLPLKEIELLNIHVTGDVPALPAFGGKLSYDPQGNFKMAALKSPDGKLAATFQPQEGHMQLDLDVNGSALPMLPVIKFDSFSASGQIGEGAIRFGSVLGSLYGGMLKGDAILSWQTSWQLHGNVTVNGLSLEKAFPGLHLRGEVGGGGTLLMGADKLAQLASAYRLEGAIQMKEGEIHGMDIIETARSSKGLLATGETHFEMLSGSLLVDPSGQHLRQLKASAGSMGLSGSADMTPDGKLLGQLRADLGKVRGGALTFTLAGTVDSAAWSLTR